MSRSGDVLNVERGREEVIEEAAALLRKGRLVAFPTETVYGLGARADSDEAVEAIFQAKGRPATNPLIVHVASVEQARALTKTWSEEAEALAKALWPGPLTLVLEVEEGAVSPLVCGGLSTVAIRIPAHPVAHDIIEACGAPVAAPSANRYTELSPTTAEHVRDGLGERVAAIVDGGPTKVGLESTLIDARRSPVEILRPGLVSAEELAAYVEVADFRLGHEVPESMKRRSPGLARKHYSPRTPLRIAESEEIGEAATRPIGVLVRGTEPSASALDEDQLVRLPADMEGYAKGLYAALHRLDQRGFEQIWVEAPPHDRRWEAVWDRLGRASATSLLAKDED